MLTLCRDCLTRQSSPPAAPACARCASPRLFSHEELDRLSIAHVDCDAFYASVEKRDRPELRDTPVIVGGGRRGVVMAACYAARPYGVRSAMPMFKALQACPDAVVIRPDMAKYAAIGRAIRAMMRELTPLVEPLSIDEAFLDLSGTEKLHHRPPAATLAHFAQRVEQEHGLTVSIGLSYNKFLAKIASDLDKPRGYAVIGRADALAFLGARPVELIWGVGTALRQKLNRDGIHEIADLWARDEATLRARYGAIGARLYHFSRGVDARNVIPDAPAKSISAETTFDEDLCDYARLSAVLWPLCEKVARRLVSAELAGTRVTLKLKTSDFRTLTRTRRLSPTQLAETFYQVAATLLRREADGRAFRLIGVGAGEFVGADLADQPDSLDHAAHKRVSVEKTINRVRERFGDAAIGKGRGLGRSA